jgi:hypothetical protein
MNTNLKKTLVTTVLAFSAGAACAGTITMFSFKDTLSPEEFLQRSTALLVEVADIGAHVAGTRDGRTFLRSEGSVPIAQLNAGIAALVALNQGRLDGETELAQWVEKCHIVGD